MSTTCYFRREKSLVLKDLPAKTRQIISCEISTQQEYNKALASLKDYLQTIKGMTQVEIAKSMRGEVMVRIGILKNISARGKMESAIEQIDEITQSGQKVGVFVYQKEIANQLRKHYPQALTITGDDTMEARNESVERFQNNPEDNIIILSIKAAGVGLTLTAASNCIFIELPWHPADATQCEDRFHRNGQKDNVLCKYLLGANTIDEKIYELIEKKRAIANEVTDTDESVEKQMFDYITNAL
jgi:SWI/SNF-related matrix-associated actin-dependent regulator 1 of chromatin subfamily A